MPSPRICLDDLCFLSGAYGEERAKSMFLHRERGVWDSSRRQKGLLAQANNQLAQKSTEAVDL